MNGNCKIDGQQPSDMGMDKVEDHVEHTGPRKLIQSAAV